MNVEVKDWKEAVIVAGNLLLRDDLIRPEYIDAMIATAEELGPYIVIAPGIAMPHARPEAGVLQTGISFIKLATPINFGNPYHDPVLIVFALAAMDKRIHVRAMQTLAELLLSKEMVASLMKAENVQDVGNIFKQAEAIR
jgi:mannitol/fructose-specific phosphotransferase system IIA component (Ntr-type)